MSEPVLNPVDVERMIEETKTRIAKGVKIVTAAEKAKKAARRDFDLAIAKARLRAQGSIPDRKDIATVETMPLREAAEDAEIAFNHAERTADALVKELNAWQSINNSVRAMYQATRS